MFSQNRKKEKGNALFAAIYVLVVLAVVTTVVASAISRDANHFRIEWQRAVFSDQAFSENEERLLR